MTQRFAGWIASDRDWRGKKPKKKTMDEVVDKMIQRCLDGKGSPALMEAALNLARKAKEE